MHMWIESHLRILLREDSPSLYIVEMMFLYQYTNLWMVSV